MSVFKGHIISVSQLLGVIPEALLSKLSLTTKVDYYAQGASWQKNVLFTSLWYCRESKTKSTYFRRYL